MKKNEDETAEEARSTNFTQALALLFVTIVLLLLFLRILFW